MLNDPPLRYLVTTLQAVQMHPKLISPVHLDYMLRGQVFGNMIQLGLTESPYFGALADVPSREVMEAVYFVLERHWLMRSKLVWPRLSLTAVGQCALNTLLDQASHASQAVPA